MTLSQINSLFILIFRFLLNHPGDQIGKFIFFTFGNSKFLGLLEIFWGMNFEGSEYLVTLLKDLLIILEGLRLSEG